MILLYIVHIVVCLFLILVVLLQQGKGADLSVFGGGSTQAAFGARSATTLLHKLSVAAFVGFIVTTLAIGLLQGRGDLRSVTSGFEDEAAAAATATEEAVDEAVNEADEAVTDAAEEVDSAVDEATETVDEAVETGEPVVDETDGANGSDPQS